MSQLYNGNPRSLREQQLVKPVLRGCTADANDCMRMCQVDWPQQDSYWSVMTYVSFPSLRE